jgi:Cys-tRNA(Pro)/Cys-tRNA(Cys) deacylase
MSKRSRGRATRGTTGQTRAVVAAVSAGVDHEVREYAHDPQAASYGEEAAHALGLAPESVFKTLLAQAEGKGLVVAVVPVAGRLDLKALAAAVGAKRATMADPAAAERATGYVIGGISPLGQKQRLETLIDASAARLERIYVSAGRRGLEIGLAPSDLAALTGGQFVDISR